MSKVNRLIREKARLEVALKKVTDALDAENMKIAAKEAGIVLDKKKKEEVKAAPKAAPVEKVKKEKKASKKDVKTENNNSTIKLN